jgi:hypothetical protein
MRSSGCCVAVHLHVELFVAHLQALFFDLTTLFISMSCIRDINRDRLYRFSFVRFLTFPYTLQQSKNYRSSSVSRLFSRINEQPSSLISHQVLAPLVTLGAGLASAASPQCNDGIARQPAAGKFDRHDLSPPSRWRCAVSALCAWCCTSSLTEIFLPGIHPVEVAVGLP